MIKGREKEHIKGGEKGWLYQKPKTDAGGYSAEQPSLFYQCESAPDHAISLQSGVVVCRC
jgi:hypothetical protein